MRQLFYHGEYHSLEDIRTFIKNRRVIHSIDESKRFHDVYIIQYRDGLQSTINFETLKQL